MKLEVGMYLRHSGLHGDYPIIQKITELRTPGICGAKYNVYTDKTDGWFIDSDYIKMAVGRGEEPQPSFNIIDILEEGDYVNGREVVDIFYDANDDVMDVCVLGSIVYDNNEIKSVITHEQMEQMAYKVGE